MTFGGCMTSTIICQLPKNHRILVGKKSALAIPQKQTANCMKCKQENQGIGKSLRIQNVNHYQANQTRLTNNSGINTNLNL